MTEKYFATVELSNPKLCSQILVGGDKYGFDSVFAMTNHQISDIELIGVASALADNIEGFEVERKYNARYFPHLKEDFTFSYDEDEIEDQAQRIEDEYFVKRINIVDEDKDRQGQIAVCVRPKDSKNTLEALLSDEDPRHFSKHTVTEKSLLN